MEDVVVFGTEGLASVAWYYLVEDSPYRVVAFTVDRAFLEQETHHGLPVVPFEDMPGRYPPTAVRLLIPLGYRDINGLRRARYEQAKAMGYRLVQYVSSRASAWPDLQVGENVVIGENATMQPFVQIGNNVLVRSSAHLAHHCKVADHAFIAAGATLGGNITVGEQCFVGLGAVVRDGVTLAERSMIGAGAVVVADTEPGEVYVGNPARKLGRTALEATRS